MSDNVAAVADQNHILVGNEIADFATQAQGVDWHLIGIELRDESLFKLSFSRDDCIAPAAVIECLGTAIRGLEHGVECAGEITDHRGVCGAVGTDQLVFDIELNNFRVSGNRRTIPKTKIEQHARADKYIALRDGGLSCPVE